MPYTLNAVECHLARVWTKSPRKMEWLEMEQTLVDIVNIPDADCEKKLALVKECLDAYTQRGHFR